MSAAIDTLEHVFDHEEMPPLASPDARVVDDVAQSATVQQLRSRMRAMQATKLDEPTIPTHPAIGALLPGGALKQGAAYSVEASATLVLALLAAPSAAGSWCGVVGVPDLGIEAAQRFGIDLERLVLVPDPGEHWLAVTAQIADVMDVVVARPPKRASDGQVARLAARLRQRGVTLLVLGPWPQTEAMLSLSQSEWTGIGEGHGYLEARQATVTVSSRSHGRPRSARLWLPDPSMRVAAVSEPALSEPALSESALSREPVSASVSYSPGGWVEAV
jgi:hypothetical protein